MTYLKLIGQGFAIGNGLTDPQIQYKAYSDYALEVGIIKEAEYNRINKVLPACELAIKLCGKDCSSVNIHRNWILYYHLRSFILDWLLLQLWLNFDILLQALMVQFLVWLRISYAIPYSVVSWHLLVILM